MEGSKISTLGMIRTGALFASLCLAGAGWAQQGTEAPAAGGTGSAEHDHGGAGPSGGADHGAMGHGGGMGHGGMGCQEMMGHGGGAGGGGGCMGGHQGGAEGGHGGGMMGGMGGMMGGGMMGGMGGMMGHGGQGGMDHGGEKGGHGGGMMMGQMMCRTTEHVDGRLAYLKAELKLADAQTPQWNAFADAIRAATQKAGQFCASMHDQPASSGGSAASGGLLAQLGTMERMMGAHLEEVRAVKTATESLFGVLSDEQKKTADQTMAGMMGFGMTMGGMGKM